MQGIERTYCDVCIQALIGAWEGLMEASAAEALRKVPYGKRDTLGLDAITEITIGRRIAKFDGHALLITEELDDQARRQWPTDSDPRKQPLMFLADPTDRSSVLKRFLETISKDDPTATVSTCFARVGNPEQAWETQFEPPVSITGACSAITCVRKGKIVFSCILNFISGTICVATDIGVFWHKLGKHSDETNRCLTLAKIAKDGRALGFPDTRELNYSADDCRHFVTFLGKSGYRENFDDSRLFVENPEKYIHHDIPPGPSRVLYLSELQNGHGPIGFILANGEKIGEWIHWLPFVKFARNSDGGHALRAFEISLERPWTKEGMLMSTSPPYSLFGNEARHLDMSRLRDFIRPSQFRTMLVVVRHDNERITHVLEQHQYREVTDSF